MNPWLSSERVCWQVGVSVCGFSSAHHQPQLEKFPGGCRAGLNWGCVWGGRRLSAAKQKEHISPAPPDLSAVEYAASVNCNYSEISFWHLFSFFSSALGWLPGCIWICNWLCVCALLCLWHTLKYLCLCQREREGGRAGTRGRFCQEEFAHMTRDLFPPNWLSMPLLPLPSPPPLRLPSRLLSYFDFDRNSWFDVRNCRSAATRGRSSPLFSVGGTGNCGLARATNKLNVLTMILTR